MFPLRSPINNSVWKRLGNAVLVRSRKLQKSIQVNNASCSLSFPWTRKTVDEQHVFMAFTVSNSVWKRLENVALARTGKL